mmetsp:Transcript_33988/g.112495  ORF Transcript_33988/g.112495 Transcript_33988/m.112495 type:complete len:240 (+) Transcript_33988:54-773(+)
MALIAVLALPHAWFKPAAPIAVRGSRKAGGPHRAVSLCAERSVDPGVSVSEAAAQVKALLPRPELEPLQVVEALCAAFQRGGDDDIEALFALVAPDGQLCRAYRSSAGSMPAFRWTIRREPRWKGIAGRPQAALLKMRSWHIIGSLRPTLDECYVHVRASPFFPDAPDAEGEVVFKWHLARQHADAHPEAAEMLGEAAGCWLVHDIAPEHGSWTVHDPLDAGKAPAPDFFKAPPYSGPR